MFGLHMELFCILFHFVLNILQVAKFKDPRDACAAIVAESYRLWLQYETRTDDITIIVVHINGLRKVGVFIFHHSKNYSLFIMLNFILLYQQMLSFLQTAAAGQSMGHGVAVRPPAPHVVEVTGAESPSTFSWSAQNPRARHDLSRARIRALENSLEMGQLWVPPPSSHRKTWEEEVKTKNLCLIMFSNYLFDEASLAA